MGYDSATNNILTSWSLEGYSTTWSGYTSLSYYPQLGGVSYFLSPTASGTSPVISDSVLSTATTLTISLSECIDDSEWANMFYDLTGADPATTSVQVRGDGENANCGKSAGKELVSGFTTIVTSSSVSAASLASNLAKAVGGPGASAVGLNAATPIGGSAGAAAAGFPTSISQLPGSLAVPGIAPAGATGGAVAAEGGAAGATAGNSGGLAGAEIAGIVVGSVAGAVLLLGVAGVVAVGAVAVLATTDDDENLTPDERRKSVRHTLRGFFGGVDVMNDPQSGHQSITARSPVVN